MFKDDHRRKNMMWFVYCRRLEKVLIHIAAATYLYLRECEISTPLSINVQIITRSYHGTSYVHPLAPRYPPSPYPPHLGIFQHYLMVLKKLFSLIPLLLALLIAAFKSSLAPCAFMPSSKPIPAGKSIDCCSSGTLTMCCVA